LPIAVDLLKIYPLVAHFLEPEFSLFLCELGGSSGNGGYVLFFFFVLFWIFFIGAVIDFLDRSDVCLQPDVVGPE